VLLERGDWLLVSDFPGSNSAECVNKALEEGMPWRGIAYAKYLVPIVVGEGTTWDQLLGKESK